MSLIKVAEMKNFRGYGDRNNVVRFSPGINLVLGDNATGKSSIVTLILFNLLNKKIDVRRFEEYRTLEPRDLGPFEATLTMTGRGGKDYSIRKSLAGKTVRRSIICDGTELKKVGELEVARRQTDAQRFIMDMLGSSEEIIEDILIQTQDPVKLLWPVQGPRDVGAKLSRLFKFKGLQRIFTNAKSSFRMLRSEVKEHRSEIKRVGQEIKDLGLLPPKKYEKRRKRLERKRRVKEGKRAELGFKREKLAKDYSDLGSEITGLEKKVGRMEGLREQIHEKRRGVKGKKKPRKTSDWLEAKEVELGKRLKGLRANLKTIGANVKVQERIEKRAEGEINKLTPKVEKCSKKYRDLIKSLEKKGIKVEFESDRDADRLRESQGKALQKLERGIGGVTAQMETQARYINILEKEKANCPVCDTSLPEEQRKKILREKSALVKELKEGVKKRSRESENARGIISLLEDVARTLRESSNLTQRLSEADGNLRSVRKKLPKFRKEEKAAVKKEKRLEESARKIREKIQLAGIFKEIDGFKREIKNLRRETKALPKLRRQSEKLRKRDEKLQKNLRDIEAKIREFGPKIDLEKEKEEDARRYYGRLKEVERKLEVTRAFAGEIEIAYKAAKASLHELLVEYRDMLNYNLGWTWPMLYPRPDLPAVELEVKIEEAEEGGEKTLVTETQLVRIGAGGEKMPFTTISSHGQRVLASIAFRVAFLNLLWRTSVPRILVLDEPTIWIDNRNRERLGELLANLVKEMREGALKLDQVIVVSHDPAFLNAMDPEGVKHICLKNEEGFCEVRTAES